MARRFLSLQQVLAFLGLFISMQCELVYIHESRLRFIESQFATVKSDFTKRLTSHNPAVDASLSASHTTLSSALDSISPHPFDLYILSQSWQPQFCHGNEASYPGCHDPDAYWGSHLTLHGLWPENYDGVYPQFCTNQPLNVSEIEKEIGFAKLIKYWPDVKRAKDSATYPQFWEHEWLKHGTCSNLDSLQYFRACIELLEFSMNATVPIIQENVAKYVDASILRSAFSESKSLHDVALECQGSALAEIHTCWAKDKVFYPIKRIPCPNHVLNRDSCKSKTIFIRAFGGTWSPIDGKFTARAFENLTAASLYACAISHVI